MGQSTQEMIHTIVEAAESRKATDMVILDLRGISSVTDFFIICSGTSDTNVRAIGEVVKEKLKAAGTQPLGVEGQREGTWVLIDCVDVIFHAFHYETRTVFALEDLWKDAKRVSPDGTVEEPAEEQVEGPAKEQVEEPEG